MRQALEQARLAFSKSEVPVGAVLVDQNDQVLAAAHNQPISAVDPTAHAEITVLRQAAGRVDNYRLVDTTLYVTLEPCVMCVGALIHARVKRIVYGAREPKAGALASNCRLLDDYRFNHRIEVTSGVLEQPCAEILSAFFAHRRQQVRNERKGSNDE